MMYYLMVWMAIAPKNVAGTTVDYVYGWHNLGTFYTKRACVKAKIELKLEKTAFCLDVAQ
jgi:hypothetical protein